MIARSDQFEIASIALGTLQIAVCSTTGLVLFAWGYFPYFGWEEGTATPELLVHGEVVANGERPLVRAAAFEMEGAWSPIRDRESGWLRVRSSALEDHDQVLVATGVALGLRAGCLNSVWLRPKFAA